MTLFVTGTTLGIIVRLFLIATVGIVVYVLLNNEDADEK